MFGKMGDAWEMIGPIIPIPLRAIRIMGWVLQGREEARIAEQQGRHQTAARKRYAADLEEGVVAEIMGGVGERRNEPCT